MRRALAPARSCSPSPRRPRRSGTTTDGTAGRPCRSTTPSFAVAARRRAGGRHGDLAQRLAARAQRERRRRQLRLAAAARWRHVRAPLRHARDVRLLLPAAPVDARRRRRAPPAARRRAGAAAPGKPYALVRPRRAARGRDGLDRGRRRRSPRPPRSTPAARSPRPSRRATTTAYTRGRRRRVRAARPGARARPQGRARGRSARGARSSSTRRVTPASPGRDRRAPAQAQGALRLVAGARSPSSASTRRCASRSRAAARSRRACCSPPPTRPPSSRAAPRSAYARAACPGSWSSVAGRSAASPPRKLDADVVVLDANAEHVAALRDPGLVRSEATSAPAVLDAVARVDAARGRVRLRAGRGQVAAAPRRARAAGRARRDRRVRLDGQRADPGPHGGASSAQGNLLACIVEWGGSNVGPGRLVRDSRGRLHGRRARRRRSPSARACWPRRSKPIGRARVTDNVRGMIWSKLLINSHVHRAVARSPACATAASPSRAATPSSRSGPRASRWATRRA